MTQREYEECIGHKVERDEFEGANRIYMACGEMSKDEFCRRYSSALGRQELLEVLARENRKLRDARRVSAETVDGLSDAADVLLGKACAYDDTDLYELAVRLIGKREVVLRRLFGIYN